jgi:hypothetical protein
MSLIIVAVLTAFPAAFNIVFVIIAVGRAAAQGFAEHDGYLWVDGPSIHQASGVRKRALSAVRRRNKPAFGTPLT